jgi:hypothetical protein
MKTIIQKVESRNIDNILEQIPNAIVHTDKTGNATLGFIHSLELGGDSDVLKLEDDIDLCDDFLNKVNEAIALYPNRVLTFFTLKNINETTELNGRTFCSSCAMFIPNKFVKGIIEFHKKGWNRIVEHPTGYDLMFGDYLSSIKEKYIIWNPSLIQHKQIVSVINPRRSKYRQAKNFKK